ncbi:MAG TPA: ABC transporter permease [Gaiellaceae bacterium]|jgi:ribose transport system permease protein
MSELALFGRLQDKLTRDRRRTFVAFTFAVIVFVVGAFLHSGFARWGSISAILEVASFVGFVAAGQTFVILVGGIDLSVPWVLNSAGILFAVFSLGHSGRAVPAVLLALGFGFAIGAVNGFCVAYLAVPAVVMTLAMNGIMEGLTLGLTKGLTCSRCNSYAPRVLQDVVHKNLVGIPADLILWFGVAALASLVLAFTTFGRKVYATGNNPTAAYLAGVNVRLVTLSLYGLSGMFAALAGIVLVSYSGQPTLGMGDPYLFQSIAAAVIGGISILGGRGNYLGTVAGAVSLVALISLLQAENMPDYGRSIVYGVAILVVLVLFGREERV